MGLKSLLADAQVRRRKRRMDSAPVNLPADLLRPKRLLVCLPAGLRELTMVKQYLPMIKKLFTSADISLLTMPQVRLTDIYPRKGYQLLTPTDDAVTWTGLPKPAYLERLQQHKFDMILDLNLEASVFTSTILLNFPQAVRIGRGNHLGSPFYNVEIKTKYLRDERNIYRSLLETLGEMMNRPLESSTTGSNAV